MRASPSVVGIDGRLTVAGVIYKADAELAGKTVVVWWGLFDQGLWVEHGEERLGLFRPADRRGGDAAGRQAETPLQTGQHLMRAFEAGFEIGAKPIAAGVAF